MPIFNFSLGESFAAPNNKWGAAVLTKPAVPVVLRKVLRFILIIYWFVYILKANNDRSKCPKILLI